MATRPGEAAKEELGSGGGVHIVFERLTFRPRIFHTSSNIRPHTEQYHTVRCTLTKRHGSPKSAQCMAKVDQIGFGGAGGDGDGGWWEALAGTARMSGEGGGGRRPAGARAMEARAEGMHARQTRLHAQSPGPSCLGGHWGSHGWAVVMRSGRASVGR